jgi:hypothetical protein
MSAECKMPRAECGPDGSRRAGRSRGRLVRVLAIVLYSSLITRFLIGCSPAPWPTTRPTTGPATRPYTKADAKLATPDYWWDRPAVTSINYGDFQPLWDACKDELYVRLLPVDREDFRDGLLTSEPVISKQAFEPWRTDAVSVHDVAESSLATIRRMVRFEFTRKNDGTWTVVPKVLVERYASSERRLTAITQYHQAFSGPRTINDNPDDPLHTSAGTPADYWYAVRRDTDLEKDMAASIRRRLKLPPTTMDSY